MIVCVYTHIFCIYFSKNFFLFEEQIYRKKEKGGLEREYE